jgi:hypothetical protein
MRYFSLLVQRLERHCAATQKIGFTERTPLEMCTKRWKKERTEDTTRATRESLPRQVRAQMFVP